MQTKPYIVQKGDSLFQIGRRLGVVPEGIYLLNRLTSDELQIGQMLRIPSYVEAQTVREDVPVYRWEDTNGEILGHVNAGTRFQVMDTTEQFLHVVYLKQIGYLYRKDAQILGGGRAVSFLREDLYREYGCADANSAFLLASGSEQPRID